MSATVGTLSRSSAVYHCKDREEKYGLLDGIPTSFWFGSGAQTLGLKGPVNQKEFSSLLRGYAPDGKRSLVQNAGSSVRQEGSELVFSVPSTLAALFAASNDKRKAELLGLIVKNASQSMTYLEALFAFTRRGSAGRDIERTKGLVVAGFVDIDNRNNQAMPHVHFCIMNSAERMDGTWGSIINKPFYLIQKHIGRVFHALLVDDLTNQLGLKIVSNDGSFEVEGISSKVTPVLVGSRKKEIKSHLEARGQVGPAAAENAARLTRRKKLRVPSKDLFERWQKIGGLVGFTELQAESLYGQGPSPKVGLNDSLNQNADPNLEKIEVISRDSINKEGPDSSRKPNDQSKNDQKIPDFMVDKVLGQKKWQNLSAEQRHAAERLTVSADQVVILEAMTGTGKDQVLAAAKAIWNKCGYKVIATTPNARQSQAFEESTDMATKPIGHLFKELESNLARRLLHHIHQLGRAILKMPTWKFSRMTLDSNSVLILDHGVMLGRKSISKLMKQCDTLGAKLVLVSDPVIRKGLATHYFNGLIDSFETAKLTRIQRQKLQPEREAVEFLSKGDLSRALETLSRAGKVITTYDPVTKMLNAWKENGIKNPRDHILVADTRAQAREINYEAQLIRRKAWKCGGKSFIADATEHVGLHRKQSFSIRGAFKDYLTYRTSRELTRIFVGDRVVCTREYGIKGIRTGMTGTIKKVSSGKYPKIWLKLDGGKKLSFHVSSYKSFRLAYAFSANDLAGRTIKHGYVPLIHSSKLIAYQQLSRGSESIQVAVTPDVMWPDRQRHQRPERSISIKPPTR